MSDPKALSDASLAAAINAVAEFNPFATEINARGVAGNMRHRRTPECRLDWGLAIP